MKTKIIAMGLFLIAGLLGCAGHQQTSDADIGYMAPASI